jgi:hypothetical protein
LYSEFIPEFSGEVKTTGVEKNGHTIYTTTQVETGLVLHTLDVDAIGLPDPGYFF